jgi:hypothetical protein
MSAATAVVVATTPITNRRPTIRIISIRFTGARVYARFRICDDHTAEPRDSCAGNEAKCAPRRQAVRDARRPEAMRCVYAELAPCSAFSWAWSLHDHAAGTGRVGLDELAGSSHLPSVTLHATRRASQACPPVRISLFAAGASSWFPDGLRHQTRLLAESLLPDAGQYLRSRSSASLPRVGGRVPANDRLGPGEELRVSPRCRHG